MNSKKEGLKLGKHTMKECKDSGTMFYINEEYLEAKTFRIDGDKLYLDGEKLPYVIKFGLDYTETESGLPLLEVKGYLVDDNGGLMVKFGELVEYNISEYVRVLGGEDSVNKNK